MDFYDRLADHYHLLYPDWDASMARQGQRLDEIICQSGVEPASKLLDVSCGIGTQSLALAQRGYEVTGSDLSTRAVERARREADARGLEVDFLVADMRSADTHHAQAFDVVLCADNSLPHLLDDAQIAHALAAMWRSTRPGGLCVVTLRDYDAVMPSDQDKLMPYGVRTFEGGRAILFQVWSWRPPLYDLDFYVVRDGGKDEQATTSVARSTYYAISPDRVAELMAEAGFERVARLDEAFYQPVITGVRPVERAT